MERTNPLLWFAWMSMAKCVPETRKCNETRGICAFIPPVRYHEKELGVRRRLKRRLKRTEPMIMAFSSFWSSLFREWGLPFDEGDAVDLEGPSKPRFGLNLL